MLAVELGLSLKLEPIAASGASLFSRGALHELPTGLNLGVPTDLKALLAFKGISWRATTGCSARHVTAATSFALVTTLPLVRSCAPSSVES